MGVMRTGAEALRPSKVRTSPIAIPGDALFVLKLLIFANMKMNTVKVSTALRMQELLVHTKVRTSLMERDIEAVPLLGPKIPPKVTTNPMEIVAEAPPLLERSRILPATVKKIENPCTVLVASSAMILQRLAVEASLWAPAFA